MVSSTHLHEQSKGEGWAISKQANKPAPLSDIYLFRDEQYTAVLNNDT